jgi:iron complex outermembrane recepter protein
MSLKMGMRALLLAGALTLPIFVPNSPAEAQAQPAIDFDLPAQDLAETLRAIARSSGQEIIFSAETVQGRKAPQIRGRLTFDDAVRAAIAGTDLFAEHRSGALLIRNRSEEAQPVSAESGTITVTGSRIRGAGSTSPVIVTTRRSLEQAGVSDLADFTRILPQNYAGGQNRGIPGSGEQGGHNNLNDSASLNLRGLGADATLTLLNGHRLSYDGLDQGVDISAIPLSAIERIEVVTDGASALYGSDAVAGVANVILRRDYEGLETTVRAGAATGGGDVQRQFSLVGGHRWSSGGFMLALDHENLTPITADQRDFTKALDPSLYLTDRITQTSSVLNAHQQITDALSFEIDGNVTDRSSVLLDPFTAADVHINGVVSLQRVLSYAVNPALKATLGAWQASLSATAADSRTRLVTRNYFNSVPRLGHLLYEDNLKGVEATAEGPLVRLPGGNARLAAGGGVREIRLHVRNDTLKGGVFVTTKNLKQRRDVQFAYGELSLPLVGTDQNIPLVRRLSLTAALRYEHWNGIGTVTTPKIGAIYQPSPDVTVRGTWGKSFKIPTLNQVNQLQEGDLIPGFIFSPPPQPPGAPVLLLAGSAPNLKPERATTLSATVELKPRFIPGLDLQATWFHIDYRDRIAEPLTSVLGALYNPLYNDFIVYNPSASYVNALIATLPGGLSNQTGAPFDPAGVGAIADLSLRNTARQRIRGVDLNADYRFDLGRSGKLLLTGAASHLDSDQQLSAGQPFLPLAGTIFHPPHWRGRAGLVWDAKHAELAAFVNYVGPTLDNTFTAVRQVGAFTTLDLNGSFRTDATSGPMRNVELRLSVLNVLNQKPHPIQVVYPEEAPYDSTNESAVGRFIAASIRKVW